PPLWWWRLESPRHGQNVGYAQKRRWRGPQAGRGIPAHRRSPLCGQCPKGRPDRRRRPRSHGAGRGRFRPSAAAPGRMESFPAFEQEQREMSTVEPESPTPATGTFDDHVRSVARRLLVAIIMSCVGGALWLGILAAGLAAIVDEDLLLPVLCAATAGAILGT